MGSQEVMDFFEHNPQMEFSTKEIAIQIDKGFVAIGKAISKLIRTESNIFKRELSYEEKKDKYGKVVPAKIFVYRYDLD